MNEQLLKQCKRIRMIEQEIARRYPEGKMRTPVHLSVGQEAAAVGVCAALGPDDLVVSTHRSHAHYLAKGWSLNALIAELYGKESGCSRGHGGSMHLVDRSVGFAGSTSIVGGTVPVGVGLAFAKMLRKEPGSVVVFHGDAAVEQGVWHESANFAALNKLPVLFVCENNGYSCYTPIEERQPRRHMPALATGHSLAYGLRESRVGDILDATRFFLQRRIPALLEIKCHRWHEHCGPKVEFDGYDEISAVDGSEFKAEIHAAFAVAEAAPWPEPRGMYADQISR